MGACWKDLSEQDAFKHYRAVFFFLMCVSTLSSAPQKTSETHQKALEKQKNSPNPQKTSKKPHNTPQTLRIDIDVNQYQYCQYIIILAQPILQLILTCQ